MFGVLSYFPLKMGDYLQFPDLWEQDNGCVSTVSAHMDSLTNTT